MVAEIYVELDDFCKSYEMEIVKVINKLPFVNKLFTVGKLSSRVSMGEVMTVLVYYHYSHYKNFKSYYKQVMLGDYKIDFTGLPSYSRFVWWIPLALIPLLLYVHSRNKQSLRTGIYYIDSTKLAVCDTHRAHQNRVFKGLASWGKTSMGWFFGLKLHLLINQYGQLVATRITRASIADNNMYLLHDLSEQIVDTQQSSSLQTPWVFGDKGYLCRESKKAVLEQDGRMILCAKPRKNQKNIRQWYKDLPLMGRLWAKKRGVVESVIGIQKNCFDLEHTRHRSPINAMVHIYAALAAYHFRPKKPSANIYPQVRLIEQKPKSKAALKLAA